MAAIFKKFGWILALLFVLLLLVVAIYRIESDSPNTSSVKDENEFLEKKVNKNSLEVADSQNSPQNTIKREVGEQKVEALETKKEDEDYGNEGQKLDDQSDINLLGGLNNSINSSDKLNSLIENPPIEPNLELLVEIKPKNPSSLKQPLNEKQPVQSSKKSNEYNQLEPNNSVPNNTVLENSEPVQVDILRVDNSGDALVAGRTEPNARVEVLADDEVIGEAESNEDGEFVIMGQLEASSNSQTLTIRSNTENRDLNERSNITSDSGEVSQKTEKVGGADWKVSESIFVVLPISIQKDSGSKIKLKETPIVVESSSTDIKILQSKEIASIEEIIIDSISYSDLGEAVLVGRANPSSKVLVYLDNVLRASSTVGASGGWVTELTGLAPGIYELRLDEVDSSGTVKSRVMTPFKKESKDFLMNMVSGSITVQTGNSLWRIARRIFGQGIKYIEIYKKNNHLIRDPDLIYPGQVFLIPTND